MFKSELLSTLNSFNKFPAFPSEFGVNTFKLLLEFIFGKTSKSISDSEIPFPFSSNSAKRKLQQLELVSAATPGQMNAPVQTALQFEEAPRHPVLELLANSDLDELSPKKALDLLYQLRNMNH